MKNKSNIEITAFVRRRSDGKVIEISKFYTVLIINFLLTIALLVFGCGVLVGRLFAIFAVWCAHHFHPTEAITVYTIVSIVAIWLLQLVARGIIGGDK